MLPEHLCEGTPAHDGSVLFVGAPVVHGLQLEFKIPGVLGQLARQDDAGDEEQQRCDQHKAADDQRGEARNQTVWRYQLNTGSIKPMPSTARMAAKMPKNINGR